MTLMSRRVCRKQHTRISAGDMTTLKAMMMIPAWASCIWTGDMQRMRRPHTPTTNIVANTGGLSKIREILGTIAVSEATTTIPTRIGGRCCCRCTEAPLTKEGAAWPSMGRTDV